MSTPHHLGDNPHWVYVGTLESLDKNAPSNRTKHLSCRSRLIRWSEHRTLFVRSELVRLAGLSCAAALKTIPVTIRNLCPRPSAHATSHSAGVLINRRVKLWRKSFKWRCLKFRMNTKTM